MLKDAVNIDDLLNIAPYGVFIIDLSGKIIFASKMAAKRVNKSAKEMIGTTLTDYFPIDISEKRSLKGIESVNSDISQSIEDKVGERWYFSKIIPIKDKYEKIISLAIFSDDITDRKRAEEDLQKSEEQFRDLYHNAPVGYFEYDLRGNITRVNHTYLWMLGYTAEEMIGQPCWQFIVDEVAREQIMAKLDGVRPPAIGLERTYRRKDGTTFPVLFQDRLLLEEDGSIKGIRTAIQDITDRKDAEKENKRFRIISDNAVYGKAIADLQGNLLYVNRFFAYIHGYEPEQLIGKHLSVFHSQEQMEAVNRLTASMMRDGHFAPTTVWHRHLDGMEFPMLMSGILIKDDNGTPRCIAVSAIDMTAHHQADESLQESEQKHRRLFETMAQGVIYQAADGTIISANPAAERILGLSFEQMQGKTSMDPRWKMILEDGTTVPGTEHPAMIALHTEKTVGPVVRGVFHPEKDVYVWLSITAIPLFQPRETKPFQVYATFEDITERLRMEQALRDNEQMYRTTFDAIPDSITVTRQKDGRYKYVNDGFCNITGYSRVEVIGKTPFEINLYVNHSDRERMIQTLRQNRELLNFEIPFRRKNGTIWDSFFSARSIIIDGEDCLIALTKDVTEFKKAEEEKARLERQLQQAQKMESIGSLAGGIAHDFNNLLFPIVGLSEMMLNDFPPDSMERHNIQEIFHAGKRGKELVQQILSFSRQSEHQLIPVHIQKILKEVLKLCRSTIPADITITRNIQTKCGPVMADPTQIHQIAMNLITNAYHSVEPTGGAITVKLKEVDFSHEDDPAVHLSTGRYAVLTVSDTGTGIDPAVMNRIFDPYFTTKEKGRGTGLGLATVYGIVKAHGGDIRVTSSIGKGATFHVYLPLLEKTQDAEPEKEMMTPLPTGTGHILLVDDEESIVHLEKQMLKRLGYQAIGYTSSRDALAAFKTEPSLFDLVITDMNMPNMNGMQLAAEMIAIRSDIPIILCTGFSERINSKKAETLGIGGLLMKPVGMKDLAQKVREVLGTMKE
jgi:PAS domain S-box-containing protein